MENSAGHIFDQSSVMVAKPEPTCVNLNSKAKKIRKRCLRMNGKYQRTTDVNF
jgi:hypothetical protein